MSLLHQMIIALSNLGYHATSEKLPDRDIIEIKAWNNQRGILIHITGQQEFCYPESDPSATLSVEDWLYMVHGIRKPTGRYK